VNFGNVPNSMDLTKLTVVWQGCGAGAAPYFGLYGSSASSASCVVAPSSNDESGVKLATGASGSGYMAFSYAFNADGINDYPPWGPITTAATYKPFTVKARVQLGATSNLTAYLGISGQITWQSSLTNLVGLYYNGSAWACVVYAGGTLNGTASMAVTPDTSVHTMTVVSTASGAATCSIDSVSANVTGTFPVSSTETFGAAVGNSTASNQNLTVYDIRGQVTGLTR
jgi:hypothetical protein